MFLEKKITLFIETCLGCDPFAHLSTVLLPYYNELVKEVRAMWWKKKEKHYLYLTREELRVVMASLVHCKNKLIREGRYTDCIDEMIIKVSRMM